MTENRTFTHTNAISRQVPISHPWVMRVLRPSGSYELWCLRCFEHACTPAGGGRDWMTLQGERGGKLTVNEVTRLPKKAACDSCKKPFE